MNCKTFATAIFVLFILPSCTTYEYAQNVKIIGFDDSLKSGKSVGPIRGEDCTFGFLGYRMGLPSIDRAFADIRTQQGSKLTDVIGKSGETNSAKAISYVKNVSTDREGFNVVVMSKDCIIVKGAGYQ